jgi:hypothetical protein
MDPGLRAHLLSAAQLPGLNDQHRWRSVSTARGDGRTSAASCAHVGFESIGATHMVRRNYAARGGARASQVLARFADAQSAQRAYAVWQAWNVGCRDWLIERGKQDVRVAPTTQLRPAGGEAFWWLTTYGPVPGEPFATYFEATGVLRMRRTIALVVNRSVGQDYNYAPRDAPVYRALLAAARQLR